MKLACVECSGTGISPLFGGRCFPCEGSGTPPLTRLLSSHAGQCRLAEKLAAHSTSVEHVRSLVGDLSPDLEQQVTTALRRATIIAKNPCAQCHEFHLEENWLGSGFCSRACVEAAIAGLPSPTAPHRKHSFLAITDTRKHLEALLNTVDVQERLKAFP